ncbi:MULTISPECIES: VOC family protein [Cupriavidus]|uniref:VOC family protein n=1 Tax=Cupriavidus TaxID=106589 RepID=UPI000399DA1E|nr:MULTISPECIES: VOC family protein [Cupriavidus]
MSIVIDRFDHIVLNVKDVEASAAWYESVLGMTREDFDSRTGKRVSLRFGQQKINLRPLGTDTVAWFTGARPTSGSDDLCFITRNSPESVIAHWLAHHVPVEAGPVHRTGALGPMTSVYCRDPDGNLIEVASYPAH